MRSYFTSCTTQTSRTTWQDHLCTLVQLTNEMQPSYVLHFISLKRSYSPLVPIAQLNDSYHLILTLDDLNKWWVLDMCGEFDLTMKLVDQNCHSTLPDSSKQSEHLWNPIFLYILWKKCFETCLDELWISIWHCVLSCNLSKYNSDMLFNSVYFFLVWSVIGTQMTNFHLLLTHGKNCML